MYRPYPTKAFQLQVAAMVAIPLCPLLAGCAGLPTSAAP